MTRMKESGIDWIGQIPEEWRVRPIKHIVETPVTDGPHETPVLFDTGIPFLSAEAVKDGVLDFNYKRGYISLKDHERFKKKISPKKDDIFIVKSGATTGNVGIVNTDEIFDIWSPLALIRCNKTLAIQKYIYFYLLSTLFKSQVEFNWSFGTQQNIGMGVIERIKVTLPPVSEQQKIVEVLDKKTAQLNKVKNLLEEQIQKLKDYRASLIYETVTKGLDKTVPMKDSGIDWIGQVPQGWGVKRLKDYVDFQTGTTPPQSIGVNQERKGVRWFKPGDFSDESVDLTSAENYITSEVVNQQKLSVYPEKTILVVGIASIGKVGYSENHSYSNQQITALKVTGQIFPKYLAYLMFSSGQYIRETALYTIVPIINNQYLSSLKIILPNRVVQEAIVEYLDKKIGQINKMIAIKNEQIKNINKQRQTLIYDYVTGKRRV
ncbi:restriction endonuclease subunit S [Streptococcus oralis]|nr:restriction modification system DNA specificity domain-containing protein [Streptococcus oralis subsp. tigurinus AZ_3a]